MGYCFRCGKALVERPEGPDGDLRSCCPDRDCGHVHYDNPVPVVAAIVEREGRIVLARNAAWPKGVFALVTGFLEKGETPDQGVAREVNEELGLTVSASSFIGYYSFFEMNQLILAYHVIAQGDILLSDEIAEVKEVLPERLKPWPFGTGPAVRDFLERQRSCTSAGDDLL